MSTSSLENVFDQANGAAPQLRRPDRALAVEPLASVAIASAMIVVVPALVFMSDLREETQKRRIRSALGQHLSPRPQPAHAGCVRLPKARALRVISASAMCLSSIALSPALTRILCASCSTCAWVKPCGGSNL